MTRDNNIYGKLVNNKFSDLLTADMDSTWLQMKDLLDREMPQDKEKRRALWISWRSTGTILAIALLFVSIFYYSYIKNAKKLNSFSKERSQDHKAGKDIKSAQDPSKGLNKHSIIFSDDNNEEFLAVINSSNSNVIVATKSIPFYQSIVNGNQSHISKNTTDHNNILVVPVFYHNANNEIDEAGQTANANQFSTDYTGEGNTADGIGDHKLYFISAMPVIEGLSTDKFLSKGDLIIPGHLSSSFSENKKPVSFQKGKGWVLGAAIHYNAPISKQEMSTVSINGRKNSLVNFIPTIFAQYYFNNKWYVETGFQFSSPQYTQGQKLFSSCVDVSSGTREENAVWLNKLYYLNIPLSIHFSPLKGLSVGTGIQFSQLKRSLFTEELATWEQNVNGNWEKTASVTEVAAKTSTGKRKGNSVSNSNSNNGNGNGNSNGNGNGNSNNNGNGNGNGGWGSGTNSSGGGTSGSSTTAPLTAAEGADTVSKKFRSTDWRYLIDVNYTWKRFTFGARYNAGLNNYINTKGGSCVLEVKDRNQAMQAYLRMNILDKRNRKR